MSVRIAIGVGCRLGSPANAIVALIRQALDRAPKAERLGIFTIRDKAQETGLIEAASRLGLDLVFLSREALREQTPFVQTRSDRAKNLFGVASVAEAAALAGAGANAVLIVPRIASAGVTCAIAEGATCVITREGVTCVIAREEVRCVIASGDVAHTIAESGDDSA